MEFCRYILNRHEEKVIEICFQNTPLVRTLDNGIKDADVFRPIEMDE